MFVKIGDTWYSPEYGDKILIFCTQAGRVILQDIADAPNDAETVSIGMLPPGCNMTSEEIEAWQDEPPHWNKEESPLH